MCSGAMILYGIKRCVMGENETFVGGESILKDHGVEVVNLNLDSCKNLMNKVRPCSSIYLFFDVADARFVAL